MIRPRTKADARDDERKPRRATPRPFWSGTISFGLISVPVRLFPASRSASLSLRMLAPDGAPLRRRYYCPEHDRVVPPEEIVRGYELPTGEHVVVTDDELEAAEPAKSREIDLRRFVDRSAIPPLHFERAYFLTPAGDSNKAYRLLAQVMEATERAGIATFVLRGREYLVAILAEGGILRAETLRFEDEVRGPDAMGIDPPDEVDEDLVKEFAQAIESHVADDPDPAEMTDRQAEAVRRLAEEKQRQGDDVVEWTGDDAEERDQPLDEEEEEGEVDLLEAIRSELRGGNGRHDGDAAGG